MGSSTIHLNKSELLRRAQALIRQGQKSAFTFAVKSTPIHPKNTPQGKSKPSGRFLKHYDPIQRKAEQGRKIKDVGRIDGLLELCVPKDVLLAHAVHVTRSHLGLRQDHLVRSIPTLDQPKPLHHRVTRRASEGLTEYEKKVWKKMKWYKPEEFNK